MKCRKIKAISLLLPLLFMTSCNKTTTDSSMSAEERKTQLVEAFYKYTISKDGFLTAASNGGIIKDSDYLAASDFNKNDYKVFSYDNSDITINLGGSTSTANVSEAQTRTFSDLFSKKAKAPNFTADRKGSGTAVSGIKDKLYDLAYLSRELESAEVQTLTEIKGTQAHVCVDAVTPIVNKDNALSNITREQLSLIYGERSYLDTLDEFKNKNSITTFSDISSELPDDKITVYTRDSSSGTRECFTEKIGIPGAKKDGNMVSSAAIVSDNGSMISSIKNDSKAIGYVSFDSVANNTDVKALSIENVAATVDNVKNGSYVLQRYFNIVTII